MKDQNHEHTWTPIPMAAGRYECPCGATGRRERAGIVAQKTNRRGKGNFIRPQTTWGGRIAPKTGH